jgi:GT2 family glycosyltransferase
MSDFRQPAAPRQRTLCVLLPVHNRGRLSFDYLSHLRKIVPKYLGVRVVIFDDGCTDQTVTWGRQVFKNTTVVRLPGNAYWGGAINAAILNIKAEYAEGICSDFYLLTNDDIRYASAYAFESVLNVVDESTIVYANSVFTMNFASCKLDGLQIVSRGIYFNTVTGAFDEVLPGGMANVADTYSLVSTIHPWLGSDLIPPTIPHYLSDYWFTYRLSNKGYRLKAHDDFVCFVSTHSTNNNPLSQGGSKFWPPLLGGRLLYPLRVTSPQYLPAWITFLSVEASSWEVKKRVVKLWIQLAVLMSFDLLFGGVLSMEILARSNLIWLVLRVQLKKNASLARWFKRYQ